MNELEGLASSVRAAPTRSAGVPDRWLTSPSGWASALAAGVARRPAAAIAAATLGLVFLFLFLGFDGRLHWDEAAYLYTGGFIDRGTILKGEFNGGLHIPRLLHIAVIAAIVDLVGPGATALAILMGLYLVALLLVARLSHLILRKVLSNARGLGLAVVCGMFTPIYLYLAFKTMPEIPALTMSSTATWALLSACTGQRLIWLPVVSLALAATAFLRADMTLLYLALTATLVLFGADSYPRGRVIGYALVSGLGALAVFAAALWALGIDLATYLKIGLGVLHPREEPLVAKLLNVALEGGIFFLAVPLAFLSRRRRDVWFCLTWFGFASLPLPLVVNHLESRYLASNLVPLIGLIYLAADGLAPPVITWWRRSPAVTAGAAGLTLLTIVGSNLIALPVMMHELRIDQLSRLIAHLDRVYAGRQYAILTPYTYTDFHYLRFIYPDRPIYTVQTIFNERSSGDFSYYPNRVITDLAQLKSIDADLVYLGYHENFAVANLRHIVSMLPIPILSKQFEKMTFQDHLTLSWMWDNPDLIFGDPLREGHYLAYPVRIR